MKLKGKLILSCAALAAVATTAFSTTYAWYTANSTVTATGIQASTASAASDALQISLDGNSWGATVDLTNTLKSAKDLTPVERTAVANNVGTYKVWNGDGNAVGDAGVAGTNYVQFSLYFRNVGVASSNVNIVGATITNETAKTALPTQKLLADIEKFDAKNNTTYTVDLLRAVDMEIVTQTSTVSTADKAINVENFTAAEKFDAKSGNVLSHPGNVLVYKLAGEPSSTDTLDDQKAAGYNAHTYYNQVKGIGYVLPVAQPTTDTFANNTYYTKSVNATTGKVSYTEAASFAANTTYYIYTGTAGLDESKNGDYFTGTGIDTDANGITTFTATAFDVAAVDSNSVLPTFDPATTNIRLANTTATTIVKATFTIYLNGWDIACFDGVKGQNISMALTFNAQTPQNNG